MKAPIGTEYKRVCFRRLLRPAILVLFVCIDCLPVVTVPAQSPDTVHISVQARWLTGDPISYLRDHDFSVTLHGMSLSVKVVQSPRIKQPTANNDTYVLLLFAPDFKGGSSGVDTVLREVPSSLRRTQLRVVCANGATTGYVRDRASLLVQLRSMESAVPQQQPGFLALMELGNQVGRRTLVYVTNPGASVPAGIRRAAAEAGALTYHVGGDLGANYTYASQETIAANFPPGPSISAGSSGFLPLNTYALPQWFGGLSIRDTRAERSIHRAFDDVARDGEGYYDLEVSVPPGERTVYLSLNLKQDYQLLAQSYSLDHRVVPDIILPR